MQEEYSGANKEYNGTKEQKEHILWRTTTSSNSINLKEPQEARL